MSALGEHMYNEYNYGSVESILYCKVVFLDSNLFYFGECLKCLMCNILYASAFWCEWIMDDREDLETLGEKLYTIIYPKHKDDAGKLTGEEINADFSVILIFPK